jgi:hypothetical protein
MMCKELIGVRRADRSTAVLIARPHPGFDGLGWSNQRTEA